MTHSVACGKITQMYKFDRVWEQSEKASEDMRLPDAIEFKFKYVLSTNAGSKINYHTRLMQDHTACSTLTVVLNMDIIFLTGVSLLLFFHVECLFSRSLFSIILFVNPNGILDEAAQVQYVKTQSNIFVLLQQTIYLNLVIHPNTGDLHKN